MADAVSPPPPPLTYGSLFSGIDAPLYALRQLAPTVHARFAVEIDRFCCETLRANYSYDTLHHCDIEQLDIATLPYVDVLCAGFPCQPFSNAGHKRGTHDERSDMWTYCTMYVERRRPRYVLFENVPGLARADAGHLLTAIEYRLRTCGAYAHVAHYTLNATDVGSCQNRERLYIVAIRDASDAVHFRAPARRSSPTPTAAFHTLLEKNDQDAAYYITDTRIAYLERRRRTWGTSANVHDVDTSVWAPCFCASHSANTWAHMIKMRDGRIRKPTAREILRLFGFGDDFAIEHASLSRAYQQAGNSMAVQAVRALLAAMIFPTTAADNSA